MTSSEAHLQRLRLQVLFPSVRVHLRSDDSTYICICVVRARVGNCVDVPFMCKLSLYEMCMHVNSCTKKRQLHVRSLLFKVLQAVKSWKSIVVSMVMAQTSSSSLPLSSSVILQGNGWSGDAAILVLRSGRGI